MLSGEFQQHAVPGQNIRVGLKPLEPEAAVAGMHCDILPGEGQPTIEEVFGFTFPFRVVGKDVT